MIEYLPYGETLYDEAATVDKTEFRFTSKEMDAETGLYYHGARYRDAKTGVWLSVDPYLANGNYFPVPPVNDKAKERNKKLPAGGVFNSVNLNAYHYAGNNPVGMIDPDGKSMVVVYKGKGYYWSERWFDRAASNFISGAIPFVGRDVDKLIDKLLGVSRIRGDDNAIKSVVSNISDAGGMILDQKSLINALRYTGKACSWISWGITAVDVTKAACDGDLIHEIVLERSGILAGYDPKFIESVATFAEFEIKTMIKNGDILITKEGKNLMIYANQEKIQEKKDEYKLMHETWKQSKKYNKGK